MQNLKKQSEKKRMKRLIKVMYYSGPSVSKINQFLISPQSYLL